MFALHFGGLLGRLVAILESIALNVGNIHVSLYGLIRVVLFGSLLLLLVLGAPIAVALGVSALAAIWYLGDNPIKMVQMAWSSVGSFPLMALPSFILAGALMEAAGVSRRLINVAESLAGPFTGGISAATILACVFFGAISGSGPATTP